MKSAKNYIQKHRKCLEVYNLQVSRARELLYTKFHIQYLKYSHPSVLTNCFVLHYPAELFALRLQPDGVIIIDGIAYQVEYQNCTPAMITGKNATILEVKASFRRFNDDYGLPAVVIIRPHRIKDVPFTQESMDF